MLVAAIVAGIGIWRLGIPTVSVSHLGKRILAPVCLALSLFAGLILNYLVIQRWSDAAVRGHIDYVLLFLTGAAAWMTLFVWTMSLLGISARDDVIERTNPAAGVSVCGGVLAVSIIYALSNVGGGPTIWTTLAPAFVGTFALSIVYLSIALVAGTVTDDVCIDRDVASGLRLAGALISAAVILGRAAGGNWLSWHQTWADMIRYGWPACVIAVAAGVVHRLQRPTSRRSQQPIFTHGLIPAAAYFLFGIGVVAVTPHGFSPSHW